MAEAPGTSGTTGAAIVVDAAGNAYTTGSFLGTNVVFGPGVS
jgi:hypothetical protein